MYVIKMKREFKMIKNQHLKKVLMTAQTHTDYKKRGNKGE